MPGTGSSSLPQLLPFRAAVGVQRSRCTTLRNRLSSATQKHTSCITSCPPQQPRPGLHMNVLGIAEWDFSGKMSHMQTQFLQMTVIHLDSMWWFSHRHRTGRWHNTTRPPPRGPRPKKMCATLFRFSLVSLTFDPRNRTWARFLYNAHNCQVSASYV